MIKRPIKQHTDSLIILLLFAVFSACVLIVLLTGARAYERLSSRDDAAFSHRTVTNYIVTKLRQSDIRGAISVEDFDGVSALTISETIDGEEYLTRVYCYDNCLRELFYPADSGLSPADGEELLPLSELSLYLSKGSLSVTLTFDDGTQREVHYFLHSGEEGAV